MSIIEKTIKYRGSKGERELMTMFDSGSTYSCINKDYAEGLANIEELPEPLHFGTAENNRLMVVSHRVSLNFYIDGDRFSDEFMVMEGLSEDALIGASTLQKWRMKLDFENDEVLYDPRVTKLRLL